MAFRRNYKRGPRPMGWKRRGAPLARKRRTWIESAVIDPCDPLRIPLCTSDDPESVCCTTRWEQVIVDNSVLQSQFSDRATVRRIIGNLFILWNPYGAAGTPQESFNRLSTADQHLYVQLIKRPINMSTGLAELPGDIWDTSNVINAYSESKALKTWWHHWNPTDRASAMQGSIDTGNQVFMPLGHDEFKDCATGGETSLWGSLTTGTGTIGSGGASCAITTPIDGVKLGPADCTYCTINGLDTLIGRNATAPLPPAWRFRFDIRKRISLREDEQLNLDFQARGYFSQFFDDGEFSIVAGGIKTLLEY